MRVVLAYICVILLWATTPLAIKWSAEGAGFLFSVTARMVIGLGCVCWLLLLLRKPLPWHKQARKTYYAVAVQIYAAMISVYWGAQFVPSGWISVLFGLTPLFTALLAALILGERSLTRWKILAYILGMVGLLLMFGSALNLGAQAVQGIGAVLLAAFLQSASAVWVKRINARIPALSQVAGGLLYATPAYLLTWLGVGAELPVSLSMTAILCIVYLGVIATTMGFVMYYFVLSHLPATRVALITLITPVMSLLIGYWANQEPLSLRVLVGTFCILSALLIHSFSGRGRV